MRFGVPTDSTTSSPTPSEFGIPRRKLPECRTCGTPMRGHKRDASHLPICPSLLPSPSPSPERKPSVDRESATTSSSRKARGSKATPPPRSETPYPLLARANVAEEAEEEEENRRLRRSPRRRSVPHKYAPASPLKHNPRMVPSFEVPEEGFFHRRNPNFSGSRVPYVKNNISTNTTAGSWRAPSEVPSEVPTVLCDEDGRTIYDDSDTEGNVPRKFKRSQSSGFPDTPRQSHYLPTPSQTPALTLYRAHGTDLPRIQSTAREMGVHTAVIPSPSPAPERPKREGSFWLLMGSEPTFVRQIMDTFQRGMPGNFAYGEGGVGVMGEEKMESPRMVSFVQLVLAGIVGGAVVIFGLGWLG